MNLENYLYIDFAGMLDPLLPLWILEKNIVGMCSIVEISGVGGEVGDYKEIDFLLET